MEARIVKILDEGMRFVLNKGKNDGMTVGKEFMIVEPTDEEIIDPETGKSLGKLEIPKGKIKVIYVKDEHSIAESNEYADIHYLIPVQRRTKIPITSAKVGDLAVEQ